MNIEANTCRSDDVDNDANDDNVDNVNSDANDNEDDVDNDDGFAYCIDIETNTCR